MQGKIIYNHEIKGASEIGNPDLVILSVGSTEKVLNIEGLEKFVSSHEAMQDLDKLGQRSLLSVEAWLELS
jgi:NADH dehydrogenase FAD-containing subunit